MLMNEFPLLGLPLSRLPGRRVLENNVSTDVGSTVDRNRVRPRVNAHGSVGHYEQCPRVCMSNDPAGEPCGLV